MLILAQQKHKLMKILVYFKNGKRVTPVTHAYDKGRLRDCQTSVEEERQVVVKLLGRRGGRCMRLPGTGRWTPCRQAGKGMDVLGALKTERDASLWQGSIFGAHKSLTISQMTPTD